MRSHVLTTLAIAGIGMGAPGVHAQSGRPSIRTSLDTAVVQVGDRLRLTIEVTHAETERVVWPDSLAIAPFEVLGARVGESVTSGDRITSSLELTLTAFELGNLVIPSFDVTIEGDSVRPLATDGWTVTVASVGLDEGGDVRDVKGPMTMPRNWWLLWPWVVGSLLVVALGWWLYRRHRLRERPATVAPFVPARSPHEVALEALETLETARLLDRGEYKEHYIRVADIFRTYVAGRFGIDALEMVTDDVVRRLADEGLDREIVESAHVFLESCDLVKFAKHTPAPTASRGIVPSARHWVGITRPAPPLVEASAA